MPVYSRQGSLFLNSYYDLTSSVTVGLSSGYVNEPKERVIAAGDVCVAHLMVTALYDPRTVSITTPPGTWTLVYDAFGFGAGKQVRSVVYYHVVTDDDIAAPSDYYSGWPLGSFSYSPPAVVNGAGAVLAGIDTSNPIAHYGVAGNTGSALTQVGIGPLGSDPGGTRLTMIGALGRSTTAYNYTSPWGAFLNQSGIYLVGTFFWDPTPSSGSPGGINAIQVDGIENALARANNPIKWEYDDHVPFVGVVGAIMWNPTPIPPPTLTSVTESEPSVMRIAWNESGYLSTLIDEYAVSAPYGGNYPGPSYYTGAYMRVEVERANASGPFHLIGHPAIQPEAPIGSYTPPVYFDSGVAQGTYRYRLRYGFYRNYGGQGLPIQYSAYSNIVSGTASLTVPPLVVSGGSGWGLGVRMGG